MGRHEQICRTPLVAALPVGEVRLRYSVVMSNVAPVAPGERLETIDVVRGFALLGILLMNILAFGLPFRAYSDPAIDGATQGIDLAVFLTVDLFAEGILRALFSMLFGAGVVMLACGPRAKSASVYYRRQFLLLAFGLFDSFVLLWSGDILVLYALCGMVLYPLRNWQPKALFMGAGLVFAYLFCFYLFMFMLLATVPGEAAAIQARADAGQTPSADERATLEVWEGLRAFHPSPEDLANEALAFQGGYAQSFAANARIVADLYAVYPLFLFWDALACMLLGMALYKTGFLQGQRSLRFYQRMAVGGLAAGVAINAFEVAMKTSSGFALQWTSGASVFTNDIGRVCTALGYASLVAIVCLRGWLAPVRRALAAVGRLALTNYILQSVMGLVIFHAIGFGLWNQLPRHQLYLVVLVEWAVAIAFSLYWLRGRRFGPLEWLWRTLTYGRLAPNRAA